MKKIIPIIAISFIVVIFFKNFIFEGLLPVPSDTIVGLYHPFRDKYAKDYPRGIPFKNFLITDPVRQQYVWRFLVVSSEKKMQLPLWNPYNFSGTPLLANFQSSPFYPLNFLFFIIPFNYAWGIFIFAEPLLAGIFLYLYLTNLKLNKYASLIGAISFSFSGFSVAWLEWGTISHVAMWLPLLLFSIDKIASSGKNRKLNIWILVYLFSLISSFFAGHLQTFFYLFIFSYVYFFVRWIQFGWQKNTLFLFIFINSLFIILTSIQWIPTLQLILLSARNIDSVGFNNLGWFIPWQNLIQFIAPDFFGNPTTLNYWGVWNYAEFVGYIGILPLIMAIFAIFFRRDKKTLFFGTMFFLSLIFSLPTFFAKIPFVLHIPFVDTAQPTRLLFITDFCLAVLSAFGFDYFLKKRKRAIIYPLSFLALILIFLWIFVIFGNHIFSFVSTDNLLIAKRNLFLETALFAFLIAPIFFLITFPRMDRRFTIMIYIIIVATTVFDLMRFGLKFTPFTNKSYLFPSTSSTSFLQNQKGQFRIMTTDQRILPPNFSTIYRLQSVDGYDPLYLSRYGELIAASQRGEPNINPPFGFNRIITPDKYNTKIINMLGVKYILSLSDLKDNNLKKVFSEGETRIYENKDSLPRAFFVGKIVQVNNKNEAIKTIFKEDFIPASIAVVESKKLALDKLTNLSIGSSDIVNYSANNVKIITNNNDKGFLVLMDSFYPTWKATIDGERVDILRADYNFRGIVVPKGKHIVEFYDSLF